MHTAEQIEKSGEHHDKMQEVLKKIMITFALPIAFLLWIMLGALVVIGMDIVADIAAAVSEWAREVSRLLVLLEGDSRAHDALHRDACRIPHVRYVGVAETVTMN